MAGGRYKNLNKFSSSFFQSFPGAKYETNSNDSRADLEGANYLEEDELILSLDVKRLYTSVPFEEAIEVAHNELHINFDVHEIPR